MIFSLETKPDEHVALWEESGNSVTYGELRANVSLFGKQVIKKGLVFCLCENSPGALYGYLGCLNEHRVALLLDANLELGLLKNLYEIYRPSYFWIPMEKKRIAQEFFVKEIFSSSGYGLFETNLPSYPMNEKLALLLTTSGSTGSSKLVRLTRENLEANAASIQEYLCLNEEERPITTLPMYYTYGLSVINSHLLAGGAILLTKSSVVQQSFWEFFVAKGATSFAGVPYTYELLKKIKLFQRKLPTLTSMTQAGGRLSKELQREMGQWASEHNIRFYLMYGQTEATARMSYLPHDQCLKKLGSIGIAIPGGSFFLKDTEGKSITEPDKIGELIYKGYNVSLGYAQRMEDLCLGDENHGVLETGDLAWMDSEGYYYIKGRKKRFVKLFGIRVGLDECEQLLEEQFPDIEFMCTGEDDHLQIYTTEESLLNYAEEWLADVLHVNRKAFSCNRVKEIPKNKAGKKSYTSLQ